MKLQVTRGDLYPAVQAVSAATDDRNPMAILGDIHLSCNEPTLKLTGTDLEVEISASVAVTTVEEPGEATLPAKKFKSIVQNLPSEAEMTLSQEGQTLWLKSGRSRFKLVGHNPEDFPNITLEEPTASGIAITQQELKDLLERAAIAMAKDDARQYFNGLLLEWNGTDLRGVTSDGHRLALVDQNVSEGPDEPHSVLVPRKAVVEAQRLLSDPEELVEVALGSDHVHFELPGLGLTAKLIASRFPDYNRIIPEADGYPLVVNRGALLSALKRMAVLTDTKHQPGVELQIEQDRLSLSIQNPNAEQGNEELEANYEGDPVTIGMNVTYLQQALQALPTDDAVIVVRDAMSPALVLPSGEEAEQTNVVMPMRL